MYSSTFPAFLLLVLYLDFSQCAYWEHRESKFLISKRSAAAVFTEEEAAEVLRVHNKWRQSVDPPASNMKELVYDDDLAQLALLWVEECEYNHPPPSFNSRFGSVSNNLYWKTGSTNPSMSHVVDAWGKEVKYYDYDNKRCDSGAVCGHYTQVVWAATQKVGCAKKFCEILTDKDEVMKNRYLVMCNYDPQGNFPGKPYREGTPGSECSTGTSVNGLCRECDVGTDGCVCKLECKNCGTVDPSSCTCSCPTGYSDIMCEKVCEDKERICKDRRFLKTKGRSCKKANFKKGCPGSCGVCELPSGTPTC